MQLQINLIGNDRTRYTLTQLQSWLQTAQQQRRIQKIKILKKLKTLKLNFSFITKITKVNRLYSINNSVFINKTIQTFRDEPVAFNKWDSSCKYLEKPVSPLLLS